MTALPYPVRISIACHGGRGHTARLAEAVQSGALTIDGDVQSFGKLVGLFDAPDPAFNIVTP